MRSERRTGRPRTPDRLSRGPQNGRVARPLDGEVLPLPGTPGSAGASYPASKAALNQVTSYVGNELRAVGVTMVSLDPGATGSEHVIELSERLGYDTSALQPVEVAAKVVVARELVDEHQLLALEVGQGKATQVP